MQTTTLLLHRPSQRRPSPCLRSAPEASSSIPPTVDSPIPGHTSAITNCNIAPHIPAMNQSMQRGVTRSMFDGPLFHRRAANQLVQDPLTVLYSLSLPTPEKIYRFLPPNLSASLLQQQNRTLSLVDEASPPNNTHYLRRYFVRPTFFFDDGCGAPT